MTNTRPTPTLERPIVHALIRHATAAGIGATTATITITAAATPWAIREACRLMHQQASERTSQNPVTRPMSVVGGSLRVVNAHMRAGE